MRVVWPCWEDRNRGSSCRAAGVRRADAVLLADTSVWAEHFLRRGHPLAAKLEQGAVMMHPFVIGELACGNLSDRTNTIARLNALPAVMRATDQEVMVFLERHALMGSGLGIVDLHLLASAHLTGVPLWSVDRPLQAAALKTRVAWTEPLSR